MGASAFQKLKQNVWSWRKKKKDSQEIKKEEEKAEINKTQNRIIEVQVNACLCDDARDILDFRLSYDYKYALLKVWNWIHF